MNKSKTDESKSRRVSRVNMSRARYTVPKITRKVGINAETRDKAIRTFADVLGKPTVEDVIPVLEAMRRYSPAFFVFEFGNLPVFASDTNRLALPDGVNSGGFGQMVRSQDGQRIYKVLALEPRDADTLGSLILDVYIETFIQVVLSLDPDVGRFICPVSQLFRVEDKDTMVIKMVPIKYSFKALCDKMGGIKMSWLGPVLGQLGRTLTVLRRKYGFSHGDLHLGNIMFKDDLTLQLIDFGYSSLTLGAEVFRTKDYNPFDLATFFLRLNEHVWRGPPGAVKPRGVFDADAEVKRFLSPANFAVKDATGRVVFDMLNVKTSYPYYAEELTKEVTGYLARLPILNPRVLMKRFEPVVGGRRRRTMKVRRG